MAKTTILLFAIILVAGVVAGVLGGCFGAAVAAISPEMVRDLFETKTPVDKMVGYSFAVGMVSGVFLGATAAAFSCFLAVLVKLVKNET